MSIARPRLLFVSNLFPDAAEPYRGLDNATLLHHLAGQYEIRVLSPRPTLPGGSGKIHRCREMDTRFAPVYFPAPYIPKIGSRFNHRLMAGALGPALTALQREFPFDVVLSSWVYPDGCAVARVAREMHFPFAVIAQGSDVHQYLKIPARRKIIVESMQSAFAIITRSGELGRLLHTAGLAEEKLHTVYNGIDFSIFQPGDSQKARRELGLSPDAPLILFVGNFLPVKNPLFLVKAHAAFCRLHPESKCRLLMIGGGPMESEIRAEARRNGFGDQVQIVGRKNSNEVANYMTAADFLCLPSVNEGVPNVILESFATGLRVIASRVGGIPEVLNHDFLGRLVEPGNLADLLQAFTSLFAESPVIDTIRNHALYFSWERAASEYSILLKKAAAQPRLRI